LEDVDNKFKSFLRQDRSKVALSPIN